MGHSIIKCSLLFTFLCEHPYYGMCHSFNGKTAPVWCLWCSITGKKQKLKGLFTCRRTLRTGFPVSKYFSNIDHFPHLDMKLWTFLQYEGTNIWICHEICWSCCSKYNLLRTSTLSADPDALAGRCVIRNPPAEAKLTSVHWLYWCSKMVM